VKPRLAALVTKPLYVHGTVILGAVE